MVQVHVIQSQVDLKNVSISFVEHQLQYFKLKVKQKLTISYAKQRMLYGRTNASLPSRFLREIPEDVVIRKGGYHPGTDVPTYSYSQPRYTAPAARSSFISAAVTTEKATYIELNKGDMVQHTAFGRGMVLSVMKMGGDALLEIAFDELGTKKLMAKTASAHLKKL